VVELIVRIVSRDHEPRRRRAGWTRDEAQCPSELYTFRATGGSLAEQGVPTRPPDAAERIVNFADGVIY